MISDVENRPEQLLVCRSPIEIDQNNQQISLVDFSDKQFNTFEEIKEELQLDLPYILWVQNRPFASSGDRTGCCEKLEARPCSSSGEATGAEASNPSSI